NSAFRSPHPAFANTIGRHAKGQIRSEGQPSLHEPRLVILIVVLIGRGGAVARLGLASAPRALARRVTATTAARKYPAAPYTKSPALASRFVSSKPATRTVWIACTSSARSVPPGTWVCP